MQPERSEVADTFRVRELGHRRRRDRFAKHRPTPVAIRLAVQDFRLGLANSRSWPSTRSRIACTTMGAFTLENSLASCLGTHVADFLLGGLLSALIPHCDCPSPPPYQLRSFRLRNRGAGQLAVPTATGLHDPQVNVQNQRSRRPGSGLGPRCRHPCLPVHVGHCGMRCGNPRRCRRTPAPGRWKA